MNINEFFSDSHLDTADGFGSLAGGRTNPHRGLDVNGWPVNTPVPSLFGGTVVRSEYQSGLGNVVAVRTDDGFFDGSAHLNERLVSVGDRVEVNTILGLLGNTGTLSFGPHVHKTISFSSDNPAYGAVTDPLPYILSARDGSGASSSSANSADLRRIEGDGISYWEPTGGLAQRIGNALMAMGALPADYAPYNDGDPGSRWRTGVQNALNTTGYWNGTPDGLLGRNNLNGIQQLAKDRGGYQDAIDADPQLFSWTGFAVALESLTTPAAPPATTPEATQPAPEAPSTSAYWPNEQEWPIDGVDIAKYQAGIDLSAFKQSGGEFVIIKWGGANTGELYLADERENHLAAARAAGLNVGFYFVGNDKLDATEQAKYFVDSLNGIIQELDIVALDNENLDNGLHFQPANAKVFLDYIKSKLPLTPFFYSYPNLIRNGEDWSEVAAEYPLWVAAYNANDGTTSGGTMDPMKFWEKPAIWQYTSAGRVPGYSANVDRNVARADIFDVYGYHAQEAEPEVVPEIPVDVPEPGVPETPTEQETPTEEVQEVVDPITKEQLDEINASVGSISKDQEDDLSQYDLVSVSFWNYAGERVIKTFAMTFAGLLTTTGAAVVTQPDTANVFASIGWTYIVSVSAVSALTSLLVALSSFKNIITIKK